MKRKKDFVDAFMTLFEGELDRIMEEKIQKHGPPPVISKIAIVDKNGKLREITVKKPK